MNYVSEAVPSQNSILFVSVLIFATTQMVAVDESQNEYKIKPLLSKVYRQKDVSQWMVSEKPDGVRGIWNGKNSIFAVDRLFMPRNYLQKIFLLNQWMLSFRWGLEH